MISTRYLTNLQNLMAAWLLLMVNYIPKFRKRAHMCVRMCVHAYVRVCLQATGGACAMFQTISNNLALKLRLADLIQKLKQNIYGKSLSSVN